MINFNVPPYVGRELDFIAIAVKNNNKLCGDGPFTKKCHQWIEKELKVPKALLTTSCTHALEMAAILTGIKEGDEVIAPSFTFVSTVNAFVLRGAKIVFVDINPKTMNLDENLIEDAITKKTKAIIVVHYAGIACEMDKIMELAQRYHLTIVEDAAQAILSTYKNRPLGSIGDFGTLSFHETKNISCGEGGALLISEINNISRAEIIREKGTDRSKFHRGEIDKYSWVDIGSSYLPSDINAAYLMAQLEKAHEIINTRLTLWNRYNLNLQDLKNQKKIELPFVPDYAKHNGHIFYIKCKDLQERTTLIKFLKSMNVQAVFHYIPLHTSIAGSRYSRFNGKDVYTTKESERLLRLPLYYSLKLDEVDYISSLIRKFYSQETL